MLVALSQKSAQTLLEKIKLGSINLQQRVNWKKHGRYGRKIKKNEH